MMSRPLQRNQPQHRFMIAQKCSKFKWQLRRVNGSTTKKIEFEINICEIHLAFYNILKIVLQQIYPSFHLYLILRVLSCVLEWLQMGFELMMCILIQLVTTTYRSLLSTHQYLLLYLHCHCLVPATTGRCPLFFGPLNDLCPQISASCRNSLQWQNPTSPLRSSPIG